MQNWQCYIFGALFLLFFILLDERFQWSRKFRNCLFNSISRGKYLSMPSPEERKKEWEYMSKEERQRHPEKEPIRFDFG